MSRQLKNWIRRRRYARLGVRVEIVCPTAGCGSGGGRWIICPDDLSSSSVVYSFGVGRDLSFDIDLIERYQLTVHAFDPTPASLQWVREQTIPPSLHFHDYGLANVDGEVEFYPPRKATSAHWTPVMRYRATDVEPIRASVKTLGTIMSTMGHDHIDILKMDIEGGEYEVIDSVVEQAPRIRQFLVEFHHAYETIPWSKTLDAIAKLRAAGFKVFDISERGYEMSFINTAHQ